MWFLTSLPQRASWCLESRLTHHHGFSPPHFRGLLPPKPDIEIRSNKHLTQSRLQITGCTAEWYYLFHFVVQGPWSFVVWSTSSYDIRLHSYGASKLPNFRILAYFPHTKPLKRTFEWPAQGYIAEWLRFFHVVVKGPKGCLPAAMFSCNFW